MNRFLILVMLLVLLYALYRYQQRLETPPNPPSPQKKKYKKNKMLEYNRLPKSDDMSIDGLSQFSFSSSENDSAYNGQENESRDSMASIASLLNGTSPEIFNN